MSVAPAIDELILTDASGALVPNATMVKPTTKLDIPSFFSFF